MANSTGKGSPIPRRIPVAVASIFPPYAVVSDGWIIHPSGSLKETEMPEAIIMMIVSALLVSGVVITVRRFGNIGGKFSLPSEGDAVDKRLKYLEDMMQIKSEEITKLKEEVRFLNGLLTDDKPDREKLE
jgi:hypothetical protein